MMQQALHICIWGFSAILLQILLSSVRLDGDRHFQVSPEIFVCVQAQILAGSFKDINRVVQKPIIVLAVCL